MLSRRPVRICTLAAVAALTMAMTACSPAPAPSGTSATGTSSAAPGASPSAPGGSASAPGGSAATATRSGPPPSQGFTGAKAKSASPDASLSPPEPPSLSWGPTKAQYDDAASAVAGMSLKERAGQVLMQFYTGTDAGTAVERTKRLHLAGSIIMGDNVPTAGGKVDLEAMAKLTGRLTAAVTADGRDWPAMLGVDQEGGLVARLGAPLTQWPTPMTYGASGRAKIAGAAQKSINTELAALGFTVNFAPDADVTIGAADPTIRSRSYGSDPELVAAMAASATSGALDGGVLPVVKHFPGHGSVTTDSHVGLPVQDSSIKKLKKRDWKPFDRVIDQGAPMIMMGHIAVDALDPGVPSSVSAAGYQALRDMGFEGVAVTDAMNMQAIQQEYGPGEAAALALNAGADLILMPADVEAAHASIVAGVGDGSIPKRRLAEAATRVVALMKYQASLAEPAGGGVAGSSGESAASTGDGAKGSSRPDVIGSHRGRSQAASAAGLTVVEGPCKGRLVGSSVSVSGGTGLDRDRFRAAAKRHGVSTGSGPHVVLLGPGAAGSGTAGSGDIAVSLAGPWVLAGSDASTSRIALYGRTRAAFDALFEFLTGEVGAPGQLPVDVGGFPAGTGCG